ncbi:hypothetical protein [Tissierella sp.]|uniref:hypothetical protein n=1 Tax=Tissierella sp. TaxID=41274 RepID=UPI0028A683F8|nr:hypothetical protein [Tissierella sp.]
MIDSITRRNDIIGKVAGINIKHIDFNDEYQFREYLNAIIRLKGDENYTSLFIEEYKNLSKDLIFHIEEFTNMKISDGENIKITNLPLIMREICNIMKSNLEEKEILVICDNKERMKAVIKGISKDIRFITAIGCEKDNDEIYEYILEETGLSLFYSSNIKRILENYSIIINLIGNLQIDFSKVRKNCIIFDFGNGIHLNNKKTLPFIRDFAFDLNDLGIEENIWIENIVLSSLAESLIGGNIEGIRYLYCEDNYYSINDYVKSFINIKGNF